MREGAWGRGRFDDAKLKGGRGRKMGGATMKEKGEKLILNSWWREVVVNGSGVILCGVRWL